MTTPLTPNKPSEELREQFQRIYLAFHDRKRPLSTYINDLMAASLSYAQTAIDTAVEQRVREAMQHLREKLGFEEEPDFDPGDATYGDTEHDHNAVVYGRNEVKGAVQGSIENELAQLTPPPVEQHPKAQE